MKKFLFGVVCLIAMSANAMPTNVFGDWVNKGDATTINARDGYIVSVTTQQLGVSAGAVTEIKPAVNLNKKALHLFVKSSNWNEMAGFSIVMGSDKYTLADTLTLDIQRRLVNPPNDTWIEVIAPVSGMVRDGSPDVSKINSLVWQIKDKGRTNVTAEIKGLELVSSSANRGLVSITIDDGLESAALARSVMQKHNMKGTLFIDETALGQTGFLTQQQIDQFATDGWDISGHQFMINFNTSSRDAVITRISATSRYLKTHKYQGSNLFAYPNGIANVNVMDAVSANFAAGLDINGWNNIPGFVAPYHISRQSIDKYTTVEQIKGWIDNANANNEWLILNFHTFVVDGKNDENIEPKDFEAVCAYLKEINIDVMPVSTALTKTTSIVAQLEQLPLSEPLAETPTQEDTLANAPYVESEIARSVDSDGFSTSSYTIGTGFYLGDSRTNRIGARVGSLNYNGATFSAGGNIQLITGAVEYQEHIISGTLGTASVAGHDTNIWSVQSKGSVADHYYELDYTHTVIDSEQALQSGITTDAVNLSVDHDFNDLLFGNLVVGYGGYSDGNTKTLLKSKVSYLVSPDSGVSVYGKVQYYENTKYNDPNGIGARTAYFSPRYLSETNVGTSLKQRVGDTLLVTAFAEIGVQNTEYVNNGVYAVEIRVSSPNVKMNRFNWSVQVGQKSSLGGAGGDADYTYNYASATLIMPF